MLFQGPEAAAPSLPLAEAPSDFVDLVSQSRKVRADVCEVFKRGTYPYQEERGWPRERESLHARDCALSMRIFL